MSAEGAVVFGFVAMSYMFAHYAFVMREGNEEINHRISAFLFFLSLLFLNLTMYAMILIAQNSSMTYLENSVLSVGLRVITYFTVSVLMIYFLLMIIFGIKAAVQYAREQMSGRTKA